MKQLLLFLVAFVLCATSLLAQSSQKFNFQAVARDADGATYASVSLGVRVSLVRGGASGLIDYSERHQVISSPLGVFDLQIGGGTILSGVMSNIDWGNNPYYLKIDIDPDGGTDYLSLGTSQLLSVPYAIYAAQSGSGTGGTDSQTLSFDPSTQMLTISNGNSIVLPAGLQGEQGIQGIQGAQGEQGEPGSTGPQGLPGLVGPQGEQGIPGAAGIQGEQGLPGATGLQGEQGVTGPQGEQGLPGTGISLLGNVATIVDLPAGANQGDLYIVQADGNGYAWDGSMWNNVGPIQGPQGEQGIQGIPGPAGIQGIQGEQGIAGAAGLQGEQGLPGATGLQGEQGETGPQGEQGLPGTGISLLGNVATIVDLPAGANQGDLYIVQADGNGYAWDGSMWNNVGPIQGPQGEQGIQGIPGPAGTQGIQGEQGIAGAAGIQGEQGESGPQGEQGIPGPQGAMGMQGLSGVAGPQGEQGESGPQGEQGIPGPQGAMGMQGLPGVAGPQGEQGESGPQGEQGIPGSAGSYTAGAGINIVADQISAVDNSVSNELQNLQLSGSNLSLTNGGGSVDLSTLPTEITLPYYSEASESGALFHIQNDDLGVGAAIAGTRGMDAEILPTDNAGVLGAGNQAHGVYGYSVSNFFAGVQGVSNASQGNGVVGQGTGGGTGGLFYSSSAESSALLTGVGKVGLGTSFPFEKVEIMDNTQTRLALNGSESGGISSMAFKNFQGIDSYEGWLWESDLTNFMSTNLTLYDYSYLIGTPEVENRQEVYSLNRAYGSLYTHRWTGWAQMDNILTIEGREIGTTLLQMIPEQNEDFSRGVEFETTYNEDTEQTDMTLFYKDSNSSGPLILPEPMYKATHFSGGLQYHHFTGRLRVDGSDNEFADGSSVDLMLDTDGVIHYMNLSSNKYEDNASFYLGETNFNDAAGWSYENPMYEAISNPVASPSGLGGSHWMYGHVQTNGLSITDFPFSVGQHDGGGSKLYVNSEAGSLIAGIHIDTDDAGVAAFQVHNGAGPAISTLGSIGINNENPDAELVVGENMGSGYIVPSATVSGSLPGSSVSGGVVQVGVAGGSRISLSASSNFNRARIIATNAANEYGQGLIEMRTQQLNIGVNPGVNTLRSYPLRIVQSQSTSNIPYGLLLENGDESDDNWELYSSTSGDLILYQNAILRGRFDATSGNYTPTSDARLKTNIQSLVTVLPKLGLLKAKKYQYKSNKNQNYHGFLAQEVQKVFPEVISEVKAREEDENSTFLIDYSQLTVLAIAAINEQQQTIDKQASEIEDLKNQHQSDMEAMNKRLLALEALIKQ